MTMRVRDMTIDDCDAVATIRVGGWRFAYTGLVPQSYLDAMNAADDAAERRSLLVDGAGAGVSNVVAEWAGEVVGWGCFGPLRDEGGEKHREVCELYAIYVRPERISSGVGHALMAELTGRARAAGFQEMVLWVLRDNARARRFYERAGFTPDGTEEPFEVDGERVPEVRYFRRLTA
ncbi:GNAT family N-acetyltransferase [Streptomyces peucetius]|uniref:GNAT family N-acetyltransferase n=1 Tax=Streptomyces peucetius TaxID=1950 RepID=A0ABY6IEQ8_STRPE|nr:GNAT family N-acetyltransferase [Streptomyces peucetius]UYQ65486.1 GNAT family N-acetyltransferase [Streptomyces peucetius]